MSGLQFTIENPSRLGTLPGRFSQNHRLAGFGIADCWPCRVHGGLRRQCRGAVLLWALEPHCLGSNPSSPFAGSITSGKILALSMPRVSSL